MKVRQVIWFCRLVLRPHPWAHPGMSRWDAWTKAILFPGEAWRIAGLFALVSK
jgi:hypothetical protein